MTMMRWFIAIAALVFALALVSLVARREITSVDSFSGRRRVVVYYGPFLVNINETRFHHSIKKIDINPDWRVAATKTRFSYTHISGPVIEGSYKLHDLDRRLSTASSLSIDKKRMIFSVGERLFKERKLRELGSLSLAFDDELDMEMWGLGEKIQNENAR
jgi:hypothetical protein